MNTGTSNNFYFPAVIAGGLSLIGSVFAWSQLIVVDPISNIPFPVEHAMNGWNGYLTIYGIRLPNWLVVVSLVLTSVGVWLNKSGLYRTERLYMLMLVAYSMIHLVAWIGIGVMAGNATLEPGVFVELTAAIWLLVIVMECGGPDVAE